MTHQANSSCRSTNSCHSNPHLWSKKKKLEVLNQMLECTKQKEEDIKEAIAELEQ
jgi:hypothetical protein